MLEEKESFSSNLVYLKKDGNETSDDKDTIYTLKQKYKDSLLLEIYECSRILHSVLAGRILVSPSGLNAIIKKLNEVDHAPIHIDKKSKFTFYSLEEAGSKYVEEILLPQIIPSDGSKQWIDDMVQLLGAFKDKNAKSWIEKLGNILEKEEDPDNEGYLFIQQLTGFYTQYVKEAEKLLNLVVVDKELQSKILSYMKACKNKAFQNVWEALNYWNGKDCIQTYRLIDDIFLSISGKRKQPEASDYQLKGISDNLEILSDKIQACLLQAFVRRISKEESINMWIEHGVETHLSLYLAEKYIGLFYENYEQKMKEA